MQDIFIAFFKYFGFPGIVMVLVFYVTGDLLITSVLGMITWIVNLLAAPRFTALQRVQDIRATEFEKEFSKQRRALFIFGGVFSPSLKRYYEFVDYQNRKHDTKGLTNQGSYTLPLAKVFVELSVNAETKFEFTSTKRSYDSNYRHQSIWHFLGSKHEELHHLAVIGPPGSGKTTLLRYLALNLCGHTDEKRPQKLIPILIIVRDYAQQICNSIDNNESLLLPELVQLEVKKYDLILPENWIRAQLKAKQCLVMLDGLDEVANLSMRKKVVQWVEIQMRAFADNRFVITSRPGGYETNPVPGVTLLQVEPFTRTQQEQFIRQWYLHNEIISQQKDDKGVQADARLGADDLLNRIRGSVALSEMAINPLLLNLIATVHRFSSELPGRRVDLYDEICLVFLGKRRQVVGGDTRLAPSQNKLVLQKLAFDMMEREIREIPFNEAEKSIYSVLRSVSRDDVKASQFLKEMQHESGLIVERESGTYSFSHLTLQEYLAACYVVENDVLVEILEKNIADSWWHECIRLYCAQADSSHIVQACIEAIESNKETTALLVLGIECLAESKQIEPDVASAFDKMLNDGIEHDKPEIARFFREGKLDLRISRMVREKEGFEVDTSLITNAEYQLFIDDCPIYKDYCVPISWENGNFPKGTGNEIVKDVHPEAGVAFCVWLSQRSQKVSWHYRIPAKQETIRINQDHSSFVRTYHGGGGYDILRFFEAHDLDSDLGFILESTLARDPDSPLVLASDLANDLNFALTRAHDRAHDLARDLARDLALDLALDLHLALNLVRDLNSDLPDALNLDLNLTPALVSALTLTCDLARARDLKLDLDLNLAFNLSRDLIGARARDLSLARDLAIALVSALTLASDITRLIARIFILLIISIFSLNTLVYLADKRYSEALRLSIVKAYIFVQVSKLSGWLGNMDDLTYNRYLDTLEALHTATFGKMYLADEDINKGILLIREHIVTENQ